MSEVDTALLPEGIAKLILPHSFVAEEIGKSKSEVFRVQLRSGAAGFLKIGQSPYVVTEMKQEMLVLRWLRSQLEVPEPLQFVESGGAGYLLLSAVAGKNLAAVCPSATPEWCLALGASYLRKIHSVPVLSCPFSRNLQITLALAEKNWKAGLVDESDFDRARAGSTAPEVFADLLKKIPPSEDLVFTHGDYCLPNILSEQGKVSGVVDLCRAGVADRHQDISLFLRSFESNTKTKPNLDLFLSHYALVRELDPAKLEFYRILDEFF